MMSEPEQCGGHAKHWIIKEKKRTHEAFDRASADPNLTKTLAENDMVPQGRTLREQANPESLDTPSRPSKAPLVNP